MQALVDIVTDASGESTEHIGGSPRTLLWGWPALDHTVDFATWLGDDERGTASPGTSDATACTIRVPESLEAERTSWLRPRSTRRRGHLRLRPPLGAARTWRSPRAPRTSTPSRSRRCRSRGRECDRGSPARGPRGRHGVLRPQHPTHHHGRPQRRADPVEDWSASPTSSRPAMTTSPWLYPDECTRAGPGPLGGARRGYGPGHPGGRGSDLPRRLGRADHHRAGPGRLGRRHRRRRRLVHGRAGVRAGRRRTAGRPGGTRAPAGATLEDVKPAVDRGLATSAITVGKAGAYASLDGLQSPQPWSPTAT